MVSCPWVVSLQCAVSASPDPTYSHRFCSSWCRLPIRSTGPPHSPLQRHKQAGTLSKKPQRSARVVATQRSGRNGALLGCSNLVVCVVPTKVLVFLKYARQKGLRNACQFRFPEGGWRRKISRKQIKLCEVFFFFFVSKINSTFVFLGK